MVYRRESCVFIVLRRYEREVIHIAMNNMSSYSTRKECAKGTDCKQAGIAHCEGCTQAFCIKHFNDHRRLLDDDLNVILSEYNDFKNTLTLESSNPFVTIRLQEIDVWENVSIEKIQQKAAELRQEIVHVKVTQIETLSSKFQALAHQIQESKEQDDFIETDLHRWARRLDDLRSNLISPTTIALNQHHHNPLIPNISVSFLWTGNELFDRVLSNDVQIEQDGEVVEGVSFFMMYNEIRGKNNYAFGCHKVRIQIEHSSKQWTFLGINSALTPLQKSSHETKSAYGWCSSDYIYSNGLSQANKTKSPIEMNTDDIITLIFDCDNRQISMINERTDVKHELMVDTNNCPFPWQFHVVLRNRCTRIRILAT
ncbi:unnamed protein product [Adineta steineri]|uniref:B30.2/SPRY domain-containing protein n=1 Tax=Adineta steineri TaxID=433720 RepID=A0A818U8E2_9BILA|nr:unnamed protein product [Adineta steineri]